MLNFCCCFLHFAYFHHVFIFSFGGDQLLIAQFLFTKLTTIFSFIDALAPNHG